MQTELLLRVAGNRLLLPRVDAPHAPMSFCRADPDKLVVGAHGILAPGPDAPAVDPAEIDLVLIPAIAIDRGGNRLGQGGGYYDRTLARMPNALKVGLVFGVQRVQVLDVDPHDLPMDVVVTESGWVSTKSMR